MIIQYTRIYMKALRDFGVEPPFAVLPSLIGVRGMELIHDFQNRAFFSDIPSVRLDHDQYHFVETIFESVPADNNDTARRLRTTLDHLANAAGLSTSRYFDADGNYTLQF